MERFEQLVEALRCCWNVNTDCTVCPWDKYNFGMCAEKLYTDAAAAIEVLQAEVKRLEPKRGEWIEDTTTYAGPCLSNYKCSLCGKICGTWRRGLKPSELPNWCGNCGADMRKMEDEKA